MEHAIQCERCGAEVIKTGPTQRYCRPCSEARDLERKRLWAREHPPSAKQTERNSELRTVRTELARESGLRLNAAQRESITWSADGSDVDLLWLTRIAVPFSYAASKNHIYAMRSRGHVALRRESRRIKEAIAVRIRKAVGSRVVNNKLWIDIFVQKPDHRGDAVNVVDLVCDGVKEGVGIDDRWFSIRRLDWEIVKEQGQLFIGVGQASTDDCQICSYCGQIKLLSQFNKNRRNRLGVGRECRDCRREGRILAKERTRSQ